MCKIPQNALAAADRPDGGWYRHRWRGAPLLAEDDSRNVRNPSARLGPLVHRPTPWGRAVQNVTFCPEIRRGDSRQVFPKVPRRLGPFGWPPRRAGVECETLHFVPKSSWRFLTDLPESPTGPESARQLMRKFRQCRPRNHVSMFQMSQNSRRELRGRLLVPPDGVLRRTQVDSRRGPRELVPCRPAVRKFRHIPF